MYDNRTWIQPVISILMSWSQRSMLRDYHQLGNEPLIVETHKYISFIMRIILHMKLKEFTATFKMPVLLIAIVNSHECFFISKFETGFSNLTAF